MTLPPMPFDAYDTGATQVSSLSLVCYRNNEYPVPVPHGTRMFGFVVISIEW